jgi:hypothetical protein
VTAARDWSAIPREGISNTPAFDPRAGAHHWVYVVSYHVKDPLAILRGDERVILSVDTIAETVGLGCAYCTEIWTPRIHIRRCKGPVFGK